MSIRIYPYVGLAWIERLRTSNRRTTDANFTRIMTTTEGDLWYQIHIPLNVCWKFDHWLFGNLIYRFRSMYKLHIRVLQIGLVALFCIMIFSLTNLSAMTYANVEPTPTRSQETSCQRRPDVFILLVFFSDFIFGNIFCLILLMLLSP